MKITPQHMPRGTVVRLKNLITREFDGAIYTVNHILKVSPDNYVLYDKNLYDGGVNIDHVDSIAIRGTGKDAVIEDSQFNEHGYVSRHVKRTQYIPSNKSKSQYIYRQQSFPHEPNRGIINFVKWLVYSMHLPLASGSSVDYDKLAAMLQRSYFSERYITRNGVTFFLVNKKKVKKFLKQRINYFMMSSAVLQKADNDKLLTCVDMYKF